MVSAAVLAPSIIAGVSFLGTFGLAALNFGYTWSLQRFNRYLEVEKTTAKYRDPLLLAAQDLQSRIWSIVDGGVASFIEIEGIHQDNVKFYTTFLLGQYLSWTLILRRQVQFLKFSTSPANTEFTNTLAKITETLAGSSSDKAFKSDIPFRLWRSRQMAVGELLTIQDGSELRCMGYAAFRRAFHAQPSPSHDDKSNFIDFKSWFEPIADGVELVAKARSDWIKIQFGLRTGPLLPVPDKRMRQLQHLLLDLMEILAPDLPGIDPDMRDRCHRIRDCCCKKCGAKSNTELLCPAPNKISKRIMCEFPHEPLPWDKFNLSIWFYIKEAMNLLASLLAAMRSGNSENSNGRQGQPAIPAGV